MTRIYLDHAATTPLDPKVAGAMADFQSACFGNPNSVHQEGQQARARIDFARADIAAAISAKPQELVFTSGATEANNLGLKGVISYNLPRMNEKPHVVTTTLEHQSVYNTVKKMEEYGVITATYVKPRPDGTIMAEDIIKEIKDTTVLVSVIFVANETGAVLPVRDIGKQIAEINSQLQHKIVFHVDAVQAFKYYNCHVEKIGCDLLTLSAHKINGPKGIGALYVKAGTKLDNLMEGGSQEYGLRPGTQNTAGIIGFAEALKLWGDFEARNATGEQVRKLSDGFIAGLKKIDNVELNSPAGEDRCPDIVSFTLKGADQDTLIAKLDLAGFAVSTGSACVSGSSEPSHVIMSMNKNYPDPSATVRATIGRSNTAQELSALTEALKNS